MASIGVVIGRFQVDSPTVGHRALINQIISTHPNLVILIGCAPFQGTKHDPLDFQTRKLMLQTEYPAAIILPVHDMLSDELWSEQVDRLIKSIFPKIDKCVLYGGRDSFQKHYSGSFDAIEIDTPISNHESGTQRRENIGKVPQNSSAFRAGIIYSTQTAWPHVDACVDIAVVKTAPNRVKPDEILLGRKFGENRWRLPGGKVDKGENFLTAARRELHEETCLVGEEIGEFIPVGSYPVGDWRLKNAGEMGIVTQLFMTEYSHGAPRGTDDLEEVRWCTLTDAEDAVVKSHRQLVSAVKEHLNG